MTVLKTRDDGSEITLRDVQLKTLEILLEFDRICKKHDIEYALSYGTALGAVRHSGFIPWDDDVDVMMDYDNYDKLLSILDQEMSEDYYYHCIENCKKYNILIPNMKFRMKNTFVEEQNYLLRNKCEGNGLFIDVFVFDRVSESKFNYFSTRIFTLSMMPFLVIIDNLGFTAFGLKKAFSNFARRYARKHKNSKYSAVNMTWVFEPLKDSRVPNEVLFPTVLMDFEGHQLPIPANYKDYLISIYGPSYMQAPPEHKREPKHIKDIEI
ncbi:LicD family protein [Erysipelothrix sp. HDW6A]|uniref:LicD family protein n=1 Tax=Erysipelothrix sp. HDW6A TaxID=2714928 RepID=UPI00140C1EC0|nr:LicD family protein [Erysipelothrix sp. HDW6A]QIK57386.1 LicD family protein [Erysipelothrix sp. HDW6A]